jgi:hypothetical protein
MKRILFTRADGGITVRIPVKSRPGETELDHLTRLVEEARTEATDTPTVIDDVDVPFDRTLRDAWVRNGNKIEENLDKAKQVLIDLGVTPGPSDKLEDIRNKVDQERKKR